MPVDPTHGRTVHARLDQAPEWLPTLPGAAVLERSDRPRSHTYELVERPTFLRHYRFTLSVDGDGEGSQVRWDAQLAAEEPTAEAELAATFGEISRQGLESLRAGLTAPG